jgi:hypothetical protein
MRNTIIFITGLLCAIWFTLFGVMWAYWGALFIAYPFGIIAFVCWFFIRNENKKRTKLIPVILSIGLALSLSVLIYLLITN